MTGLDTLDLDEIAVDPTGGKVYSGASRFRQKHSARALKGRLGPQDSNDEPANVFLERLRTNRSTQNPIGSGHEKNEFTKAPEEV